MLYWVLTEKPSPWQLCVPKIATWDVKSVKIMLIDFGWIFTARQKVNVLVIYDSVNAFFLKSYAKADIA